MEIWKDIEGYEGYYQVSDLGRVRSLDRIVINSKFGARRKVCGIVIRQTPDKSGYLSVGLRMFGVRKTFPVHKIVAIAFHDHVPSGYTAIVDHINNIKTDNRATNLQIVSNRKNSSKDKFRYRTSSTYVGVCWHKRDQKWTSSILIDGKRKHLGYFTKEVDATEAYQKALSHLKMG